MPVLALLGGLSAIAATLLPLSRKPAWWIRVFDFPRLQVALLAASSGLAFRRRTPGSVPSAFFHWALAGCAAYQLARIFPYTRLARKQAASGSGPAGPATLRLMCANVQLRNRNAGRLLAIVACADPDIFLALEPDDWWREQLRPLEARYPCRIEKPQDNTYGMLLYSRLELVDPEIRFLVQPDVPSIHTLARLPSGDLVELHCLHPRPPVPPRQERSTERDAEILLVGARLKGSELPQVVMGDLNDVAWSRTTRLFQEKSGLLDPRRGRGLHSTFHAKIPPLRFPLDHFFHSRHFRVRSFERLPYFGSDHFPILISLDLDSSGRPRNNGC